MDAPRSRLGVSLLGAGLAALWLWNMPNAFPTELRALLVWCVYAGCFLGLAWLVILTSEPADTRESASRQDDLRTLGRWWTVLLSIASLIAAGLALSKAGTVHNGLEGVLTACALLSVALAWGALHTLYTLHYAHLYYTQPGFSDVPGKQADPALAFPGESAPDYLDFAYLAFTIGATFQVSDVTTATRALRRTVLGHALLSYLFGTVVFALTINVVAGLL